LATLFRSENAKTLVHARYRSLLDNWPVPRRELTLPTRYGHTFVIVCGPENAPALLLLHGGATTSAMWGRSVRLWAEHFRVYAVDIIGEPGLSAPARPSLRSDAYVRWLEDLWSALGLSRASMVGASLGGLLALQYAAEHPARVKKLVLLAPAGIAPVRVGYLISAVPLFFLGPHGRRKALELVMGLAPEERTEEAKEFLSFFELILAHHVVRTQPIPVVSESTLRKLTMPVLVVVGARDIVFRAETMRRRIASFVPDARTLVLEKAGHGLTDQTSTIDQFLLTNGTGM